LDGLLGGGLNSLLDGDVELTGLEAFVGRMEISGEEVVDRYADGAQAAIRAQIAISARDVPAEELADRPCGSHATRVAAIAITSETSLWKPVPPPDCALSDHQSLKPELATYATSWPPWVRQQCYCSRSHISLGSIRGQIAEINQLQPTIPLS
jgi:hypothetical protein